MSCGLIMSYRGLHKGREMMKKLNKPREKGKYKNTHVLSSDSSK